MTGAAFNLCRDVINLLRQCYTRAVAGCTIVYHNSRVMDKTACECTKAVVDHIMAGRTVLFRRDMTHRLACADITVMAGQAVAGIGACVVKRHIGKVGGVMAYGAVLVVGTGRYVIRQFTSTNHIVMTGVTATHERRAGMIKGASGKGARGVTNTAIFSGRHVVERFTAGINTMTGGAIVHDIGMVDKCTSETIRVMARSTIVRGSRMSGYRRSLSGRINTIVIIVA